MYGQLVTALLQLGHRREALEAYQQFEARVVGELGLLRSPRMQELAERIRAGKRG
jgi:DNA-binding SARP family transcriptional activator